MLKDLKFLDVQNSAMDLTLEKVKFEELKTQYFSRVEVGSNISVLNFV